MPTPKVAQAVEVTDLTRPIIGIENRTPLEVFDIMCDRIKHRRPSPVAESTPSAAEIATGRSAVERKAETLLAYLRDRSDSEFASDVAGEFGEDLKARIEGVIANLVEAALSTPTAPEIATGTGAPTWFRFDPSTGEWTGEYCSVKPHDATHFVPMVRLSTPTDATAVEAEREAGK